MTDSPDVTNQDVDPAEPHVPEPPDLEQGPTVDEAKAVAAGLTHVAVPGADVLPTDVKMGDKDLP